MRFDHRHLGRLQVCEKRPSPFMPNYFSLMLLSWGPKLEEGLFPQKCGVVLCSATLHPPPKSNIFAVFLLIARHVLFHLFSSLYERRFQTFLHIFSIVPAAPRLTAEPSRHPPTVVLYCFCCPNVGHP